MLKAHHETLGVQGVKNILPALTKVLTKWKWAHLSTVYLAYMLTAD